MYKKCLKSSGIKHIFLQVSFQMIFFWIQHTGMASFLLALNIFLSITASLGNALILVALHKETSLHPPTKLLFRCLAVTDLCVGTIAQPVFAFVRLSSTTNKVSWEVINYMDRLRIVSAFVLCQVSIFTSSAISVDRLQALLSGLRYRQVVTLLRVRAVLICFWLFGMSCASICFWSLSIASNVAFALIILSLTTSVFSYSKIYWKLRQHQLQLSAVQQPNRGRQMPLNVARFKKSVSSILWVQMASVTCYIPYIIVQVFLMPYGQTYGLGKYQTIFYLALTLMYLNSSLNPILYCWRIREVRQAAKEAIKQLKCCCWFIIDLALEWIIL